MRDQPTGRDHPSWKGGAAHYRGPGWAVIRDAIKERDGWRCVDCGRAREQGKLDVHHLVPAKEWDRPGPANDPENLVTLCPRCHTKRHANPAEVTIERRRARAKAYYETHRAERIAYAVAYQREYRKRRKEAMR
jgi:5-methylcytosine-specific restriction endonuclease McrA